MESEERQGSACHKPAYSVYNQMQEDLKAPSISLSQSKQIDASGEDHAPRIRKPYTITKQRERWTEEEHNKFVEALQLYGRSWRQIEEHIGTKTAVQIRSHAQKFFSKVVREAGSSDNASTLKAIEIPPPRPKKKPVHPYPRKCGNLSNSATPVLKPFQRPLHVPAICEIENRSPTSVLSAVGSENLDSTFSNCQMGFTSPVSSAAGSNDQEEGGLFTMAVQEENKLPPFGPAVPKSTTQANPQGTSRCPDVRNSPEGQAPTLKLFGKMVVVMDSNKSSTPSAENVSQSNLALFTDPQGNQGNKDFGGLHSNAEHLQTAKQASSPEEPSRSPWHACPALVPPLFYCFPLVGENNSMIEPAFVQHPWWGTMYGNLPFPLVHPQSQHLLQSGMQAGGEQEALQREGSWTGSNTESISGTGLCNQNSDGVDSKKVEVPEEHGGGLPCSGLKRSDAPSSTSGSMGSGSVFVPYKRCAVESEEQHSATPSDDSESQAIRLCL